MSGGAPDERRNFQGVALTTGQLNLIRESLRFSRDKFREYRGYPSEEFRRQRIRDVDEALAALRAK